MSRLKNTLNCLSKIIASTSNELRERFSFVNFNPATFPRSSESVNRTSVTGMPVSAPEKRVKNGNNDDDRKGNGSRNGSSKPVESSIHDVRDDSSPKGNMFSVPYFGVDLGEASKHISKHVDQHFWENEATPSEAGQRALESSQPSPEKQPVELVSVQVKSGVEEPVQEKPASARGQSPKKKAFSDHIRHPVNLVGGYVTGLASKLREPRLVKSSKMGEKDAADFSSEKEAGPPDNPGKALSKSEEKMLKLQLQREKVVARVSADSHTRCLVQDLRKANDLRSQVCRLEDLNKHLVEYPESRLVAVEEKAIPCLLRMRQAGNERLQASVREALSLVGYVDPVRGFGIRVLSIDGGGTRGLVALQTLKKLEGHTGKPVHEMFDYICGVSTGAILAFMLGVYRIPLQECEEMYRQLGSDIFTQNVFVGTMKMGWSHAFYDSQAWEKILKERMGESRMIETARNSGTPKVVAVSTVVNVGSAPKPFVFRNYNHRVGMRSHYPGACSYRLWEAIRASSAAPGYFQEYKLNDYLHQDGALTVNNPCGLALHECQLLWPGMPWQCVVSLGTGRHELASSSNVSSTSLRAKLSNVITSATDTEEVHTMLDGLLPADAYFRFNPLTREDVALDERRAERLNQLQNDAHAYLERNGAKLERAAARLSLGKPWRQCVADRWQLWRDTMGVRSTAMSKL
ncbi:calcium-independent phospholipase A2-gamma [Petromyzon marinus]|uniref:calcium-independent phospholipase A2-gamma n=1 Tax=Petromyzon marinus TaxID=7757 RepID=UPI003F72E148